MPGVSHAWGFITDEEWVSSCEEMHPVVNSVPQPIARLEAAFKKSLELVIDASVGAEAAWATTVLKSADGIANPASKWIVRPDRQAIKKDLQALVLVGTADLATQDAENK